MRQNIILNKTFQFSLLIIELYKKLTAAKEYIISRQLMRSGTGIGANVEEAVSGFTKREFHARMSVSLREARETRYWLRLLKEGELTQLDLDKELTEIEEIINILYKIVKTTRARLLIKAVPLLISFLTFLLFK